MNYNSNYNIAILGATSHIAKGLIYNFCNITDYNLFLFARSPEKVEKFIEQNELNTKPVIENFDKFYAYKFDCIINCFGIGRSSNIEEVFELTEIYDNLSIYYLKQNNNCLYINFSSGAVYGDFNKPVEINSAFSLEVNNLKPENYYSLAKINSEAKHRALKYLNIVDLRVFSYFSRFIDLDSGYLITEIIKSIKNNDILKTNSENIIRDYTNPDDVFSLILKCFQKDKLNDVFDIYSIKPVGKFEMLDFYSEEYGLKYTVDDNLKIKNPTGDKEFYYSLNYKAKEIGFEPKYSSIQAIENESKYLLNK